MSDADQKAGDRANQRVGPGTVLRTVSGEVLEIEASLCVDISSTHVGAPFLARTASGEYVKVRVYDRRPPFQTVFNQEQSMGRVLTHPNIVKISGRGMFGDMPFTVCEYFAAGSLFAWRRSRGHLTGPDLLSIATQLASAIDFAHSRGVIHENISPRNVWLDSGPGGRVALGDFGFNTAMAAWGGFWLEWPGGGPPLEYVAPELLTNSACSGTGATDIYSFGVLLYECAAGEVMFKRSNLEKRIVAKMNEDFPNIRTCRPDVPEQLAARLAQTLSRDPGQRPCSASAVLSGVEEYIARL